ncbi:hypothetical protein ACN47E_006155 [Coniothyrium glycines]
MLTLDDIVGVGACDACRGRITKCSIDRPKCSECIKRGSDCNYSPPKLRQSVQQSRISSNNSRETKEAFAPAGERRRQDAAAEVSSSARRGSAAKKRRATSSQTDESSLSELTTANVLQDYRIAFTNYRQTDGYRNYQTYLDDLQQQRQRHDPGTSFLPGRGPAHRLAPTANHNQGRDVDSAIQTRVNMGSLFLESPSSSRASPVVTGMDEVRSTTRSLGVNPDLIRVAPLPTQDVMTRAVDDFLSGTGALINLWTKSEAHELISSIYDLRTTTNFVYTTEVFAMAAVGSYCDGDHHTAMVKEQILHHFLYLFSADLDMDDFRRMRLLASMALCRFTNNVDSARKLILSALDIGRQKFSSSAFVAAKPGATLRYWWNVFRSIVFLESWFASNTNHTSRITHQDLTLYQPARKQSQGVGGSLQDQVGELGQLAAYISLDLDSARESKIVKARVHLAALNDWHRMLPPPMQLSRLSLANPLTMDWHTKRTLLQLHILFLGVFLEPHRTFLVQLGRIRLGDTTIDAEEHNMLKNIEAQCNLAARQCSRVASLLQVDDFIRSHCWVSVYTSFAGCSILLFGAAQKLLELLGEEIGHDLAYATAHLNILSLCSSGNSVARNLYTSLQIIFNDIREVLVSPVYRAMREQRPGVRNIALVAPSHFGDIDGAEEIGKAILDLTRRTIGVLEEALVFKD